MKIENTTEGKIDVNIVSGGGILTFGIPARSRDESGRATNGVGEVPDDLLEELLAKSAWAKSVFASGDLVRVGAPAAYQEPVLAAVDEALATPVSDSKGKSKK